MDTRLQQAPPVTNSRRRGRLGATSGKPRSLPIAEWPASDCLGWTEACQPALRLKRGGAASHLAPVSQADIARRYGLYLDFIINLRTAKALMMGPRRERRRCDDSRHHPKRSEPGVLSVWAECCRPANESERKR